METFCTFVGKLTLCFVFPRLLTCAQKSFLVSLTWIAYWVGQHRVNFTRYDASQFADAGVHPTDPEQDSDQVKEGKTKGKAKGKGRRRSAKRHSGASAAAATTSDVEVSDVEDEDFQLEARDSSSDAGSDADGGEQMSDEEVEEEEPAATAAPKKKTQAKKKRKSVGTCKPRNMSPPPSPPEDDGSPRPRKYVKGSSSKKQPSSATKSGSGSGKKPALTKTYKSTKVASKQRTGLLADRLKSYNKTEIGCQLTPDEYYAVCKLIMDANEVAQRTNRKIATNGVRQALFFHDSDNWSFFVLYISYICADACLCADIDACLCWISQQHSENGMHFKDAYYILGADTSIAVAKFYVFTSNEGQALAPFDGPSAEKTGMPFVILPEEFQDRHPRWKIQNWKDLETVVTDDDNGQPKVVQYEGVLAQQYLYKNVSRLAQFFCVRAGCLQTI